MILGDGLVMAYTSAPSLVYVSHLHCGSSGYATSTDSLESSCSKSNNGPVGAVTPYPPPSMTPVATVLLETVTQFTRASAQRYYCNKELVLVVTGVSKLAMSKGCQL